MADLLQTKSSLLLGLLCLTCLSTLTRPAMALPPPEDIPEEVLRSQPSMQVRSSDNQPLTPSEYGQQAELADANQVNDPNIDPELQQLIFLLKLRQGLRSILP